VRGGRTVSGINETSSTDERVAATGSTSLDLGVPRPRVGLCLLPANYSHEDVGLNAGDAALTIGVLALRAVVVVVVVVVVLHDNNYTKTITGLYRKNVYRMVQSNPSILCRNFIKNTERQIFHTLHASKQFASFLLKFR